MDDNMNNNINDNEEYSEQNLLTLLDEDNQEHQFELVDSLEHEGTEYLALIPIHDNEDDLLDDDDGELVVMKVTEADGEEYIDIIEDEETYNIVGELFTERLADLFDFHDGDDEEEE